MPDYGLVEPGVETWSESLMLLHFDPEVRHGISVRVSRYPDMNATWVWCHVLFDGRMYAFTERRLCCSPARNLGTASHADYDSREAGVAFGRLGPVAQLEGLRLSVKVRSRQSSGGRDGSGDIPVAIDAVFRPQSLKKNLPPGRSEWTGQVEVDLRVAGQARRLTGVAKAHEQTQTAPRFDVPFTYGMMWSPAASFIANSSPKKRYGEFEADGLSHAVTDFRPDPPDVARRFAATLDNGQVVKGLAMRVASYDVPVFDRVWNGNIVRVDLDGRRLVGMLNDWRPDAQIFRPL
ncbi:MAG: hypothetical protein KIS90_05025 [Phenylobacterium sp.]|nr:hypothetical protein [Phenylobacterium sp.]